MPGLSALSALADAGDQPAAADAGDDRRGVRCILENLQAHGAVAGDEIVIVERMHEGPFDARIARSSIACQAPA